MSYERFRSLRSHQQTQYLKNERKPSFEIQKQAIKYTRTVTFQNMLFLIDIPKL